MRKTETEDILSVILFLFFVSSPKIQVAILCGTVGGPFWSVREKLPPGAFTYLETEA